MLLAVDILSFSDCFQVKFYENINQISAPVDIATAGFSQNNPEHNFEADIDFVFEVITDTVDWLKFTSYYKAIGNEKVAVFGCFREPENINGMGVTNVNQLYYNYGMGWYIDDISLKSINSIKIPNLKINCDSLPNIITPNKDGINDKLTYLSNDEKELELIIYNRWGNIIHKEKRIQVEFPKDNSVYNDGVYFYILKNDYSTCKNSLTIKKSFIVLPNFIFCHL